MQVLQEARGIEISPAWANGAKIFAPVTPSDIEEARIEELCPHHVVLRARQWELLEAALKTIPYKRRPRIKHPEATVPSIPQEKATSLFAASAHEREPSPRPSDHEEDEEAGYLRLRVINTFISAELAFSETSERTARTI